MTRFGLTAALLGALAAPAAAQRGPAPTSVRLPSDVLTLACAPFPAFEVPNQPLRITGGQDSVARRIYAPGDLVTINAGTTSGIEVGQEYFVRRIEMDGDREPSRAYPGNVRTAGWVRIYAIDEDMSLATISYACDSVEVGDYLEPFSLPPPMPVASSDTLAPQKSNYGRILFGADHRRSIGKGELFIVDRGSDHGVTPGARFVVYHDKQIPGNFLFEVGEAVVVEVRPDTSTLLATLSRDAFIAGDYVALRK